jgi:hypothetical protein
MIVEASTIREQMTREWQQPLQQVIALLLLGLLVWGIGSFYSIDQTRWILCEYIGQRDEVPFRVLREFLNGQPDSIFQSPEDFLETEDSDDENHPLDEPAPEDERNYYASGDLTGAGRFLVREEA